jgi:hypothetical protein
VLPFFLKKKKKKHSWVFPEGGATESNVDQLGQLVRCVRFFFKKNFN